MIHSMSGGVIKDPGSYTFVKAEFDDGTLAWYISDFAVEEGDTVSAPRGRLDTATPARVVKVEAGVSGQVTPVPLRSAKRIYSIIDSSSK